MILERLYVGPFIKKLNRMWPKWKMTIHQKYFGSTIKTTREKHEDSEKWKKINETIEFENESIELLIESFSSDSVDIICGLLLPVIQVIFVLFYSQVEIPTNYGIGDAEMLYFTLFSFFMIPWKIAVNVLVLNTQEVIHGWRIYDYIAYQRYRFITREKRWLMDRDFLPDESITSFKQSIDSLCFSDQYFFLITIYTLSMFFSMIGVTVILRANYNPFGDPVAPIVVLIFSIGYVLTQHIFIFACNIQIPCFDWRGLWTTKEIGSSIDDEIASKLAIGEGRKSALEQQRLELDALNNDKFRMRFLNRNRAWLLQNLEELLTPRSLRTYNAEEQVVEEYVRDIYVQLLNIGKGARRMEDRLDISSDDGDELEQLRRGWSRITLAGPNLEMAKLWLSKARKRRTLSKLVAGIIRRNATHHCRNCGRQDESGSNLISGIALEGKLNVNAIDSLILSYEQQYGEDKQNTDSWKSFFSSNADFITSCSECLRRETPKAITTSNVSTLTRLTRAVDISSDEEEDDSSMSYDQVIITEEMKEFKMMLKWLKGAQAKLGRQPSILFKNPTSGDIHKGKQLTSLQETNAELPKTLLLNEHSKAIAKIWLKKAHYSESKRFIDQGVSLRERLRSLLVQMPEEDDWFYGEEFRIQGNILNEKSLSLEQQYNQESVAIQVKIHEVKDEDIIQRIKKINLNKINKQEKEWRRDVNLWMSASQRKIESKLSK